jgi:hypothetical protein
MNAIADPHGRTATEPAVVVWPSSTASFVVRREYLISVFILNASVFGSKDRRIVMRKVSVEE